jgi:hypothetical protein
LGFWVIKPQREPVLSGKSVGYWLSHLPPDAGMGFLGPDHPLEAAGPEIIPFLTAAIDRSYGARRLYNKVWQLSPALLRMHLPKPTAPEGAIKTFSAFRLGQFGPLASNAVPSLIRLSYQTGVNSPDKGRVFQALGDIGPPARPAVPVLLGGLRDTNTWISDRALESLLQIGEVPKEAIPILDAQLRVPGIEGYRTGARVVGIWDANRTPESLARVEEFLASPDRNRRAYTSYSLGYSHDLPETVISKLTRMLDDKDAGARQGAAIALANAAHQTGPRVIAVLCEGLESGQFQIPCAQALGRMGPAAKSALPVLQSSLKTEHGSVLRRAVSEAITNIGP